MSELDSLYLAATALLYFTFFYKKIVRAATLDERVFHFIGYLGSIVLLKIGVVLFSYLSQLAVEFVKSLF